MTIAEMLEQSAILTVLGVGVVFLFLIIMVICVTMMGKIIRYLESGKNIQVQEAATQATTQEATTAAQAVNNVENGPIIAAITAAVNEYRKSQGN